VRRPGGGGDSGERWWRRPGASPSGHMTARGSRSSASLNGTRPSTRRRQRSRRATPISSPRVSPWSASIAVSRILPPPCLALPPLPPNTPSNRQVRLLTSLSLACFDSIMSRYDYDLTRGRRAADPGGGRGGHAARRRRGPRASRGSSARTCACAPSCSTYSSPSASCKPRSCTGAPARSSPSPPPTPRTSGSRSRSTRAGPSGGSSPRGPWTPTSSQWPTSQEE
jgi:hypothetical protein